MVEVDIDLVGVDIDLVEEGIDLVEEDIDYLVEEDNLDNHKHPDTLVDNPAVRRVNCLLVVVRNMLEEVHRWGLARQSLTS